MLGGKYCGRPTGRFFLLGEPFFLRPSFSSLLELTKLWSFLLAFDLDLRLTDLLSLDSDSDDRLDFELLLELSELEILLSRFRWNLYSDWFSFLGFSLKDFLLTLGLSWLVSFTAASASSLFWNHRGETSVVTLVGSLLKCNCKRQRTKIWIK